MHSQTGPKKYLRLFSLSLEIAKATFKLRNEGSYLGILWYLLNPILMFILLFVIFANRLGADIPDYAAYLLLGIIMFNYFQAITQESTQTIRLNSAVIKTMPFPLASLNLSVVFVAVFSHILELGILIILLIVLKVSFWGIVLYPLIIILFSLFCLGCSLVLSSLAVYFMDLYHIWAFAVRLLWLATPIFYSVESDSLIFKFNLLNPVYYYITIARDLIIYGSLPEPWVLIGAVGFTALTLTAGLVIHKNLKNKFAELI